MRANRRLGRKAKLMSYVIPALVSFGSLPAVALQSESLGLYFDFRPLSSRTDFADVRVKE